MERGSEAARDQDRGRSSQKEEAAKTRPFSFGFRIVRFPRTDRVRLGFEI
jgi:hypothetical protein